MDIFLLMISTYLVVLVFGNLINKYLRLPWMFTVVIFGMLLSAFHLFDDVMAGETFQSLARLGMLFFLFTVGVDLEFDQIKQLGRYIVAGDILLTMTEGLLLAIIFYFGFPDFVSHNFLVALLSGVAFGTVGEVLLLSLLKEFGLEGTRFGQLALGIAVFDDIFEILALAIIVALPPLLGKDANSTGLQKTWVILITLAGIFLITILVALIGKWVRKITAKWKIDSFTIPFLILFVIFGLIYFSSLGTGDLGVVAAIFSGIAIKQLLPEGVVQHYKKPFFFLGNFFLGPFFFLSLGGKVSLSALAAFPLLILVIMAVSILSRLLMSFVLFRKLLGRRASLVMGFGLTMKFNTSVISENILLSAGLIAQPLYSAMMAAFILLKPIIVAVFSRALASSRASILQSETMQNPKASSSHKRTVLFLCTGNSARSQMAEALVNATLGDRWTAFSAGTRPTGVVHPLALKALKLEHIDHAGRSKSIEEFKDKTFDLIITVCDSAAQDCPTWLGKGRKVHISIADPAVVKGSEKQRLTAFQNSLTEIKKRIIPELAKMNEQMEEK